MSTYADPSSTHCALYMKGRTWRQQLPSPTQVLLPTQCGDVHVQLVGHYPGSYTLDSTTQASQAVE